jgi:glutamine amidotransferase
MGNLSSVRSGFARAGAETVMVSRGEDFQRRIAENPEWTGLVLPGVGAFGDAMFQLRASGLLAHVRSAIREGRPLLGICLGMQLLFAISEEHGTHIGLGVFPGKVVRFGNHLKVPHMGWNTLTRVANHPLLAGVQNGDFVYFVHSYHAVLNDMTHLLAGADYGGTLVPAVVAKGNVFGTQFHPEKSGEVGERILRNFVRICQSWAPAKGESAHV